MNPHGLQGRDEHEVLWFRRRGLLRAAAAWSALARAGAGWAQQPTTHIVAQHGDVQVNDAPLDAQRGVQASDRIETGPDSTLTLVLGDSALHLRQNSHVLLQPADTASPVVGLLRLLTGAVVGIWGPGVARQVITPTAVIGIRGTGTYAEVFPEQGGRSYFCTCYGRTELASGGERRSVDADYHEAYWAEPLAVDGHHLVRARLLNHTDEEVEFLAQLIQQRTAWQITGHKMPKGSSPYY